MKRKERRYVVTLSKWGIIAPLESFHGRKHTRQFPWVYPLTSESQICQNHHPQTPGPPKSSPSAAAAQPWPTPVQQCSAGRQTEKVSDRENEKQKYSWVILSCPREALDHLHLTHINYLGAVSSYCALLKNELQVLRPALLSKVIDGASLIPNVFDLEENSNSQRKPAWAKRELANWAQTAEVRPTGTGTHELPLEREQFNTLQPKQKCVRREGRHMVVHSNTNTLQQNKSSWVIVMFTTRQLSSPPVYQAPQGCLPQLWRNVCIANANWEWRHESTFGVCQTNFLSSYESHGC